MTLSPCTNSVFQWIYDTSESQNAILIACCVLLIPATILANILVVYTVVKTKQIQQGVNDLFICLSVSDTFIAVACEIPLMILMTAYRRKRNCILELWIQYSSSFLCNLSGMIILSIAIDRYIQTLRAIKMKLYRKNNWSMYFMILSVTISLMAAGVDVLGTFMANYSWINTAIQLLQLIVIVSVCLLYVMTYYTVLKNRRQQGEVLNVRGIYQHSRPNVPYIRAMIVTITMILGSLIISYFPLLITGIITAIRSTGGTNATTPRNFWNYLSFFFGFTSSLLSALIFLYRNKQCRLYLLSTVLSKRSKLNEHSASPQTFVLKYFRSTKVKDIGSAISLDKTM